MQKYFCDVHGFHLIEILITLAIISLFTIMALPTYTQYLTHTRRLEAANYLSKLSLALENYYIEFHTYEKATLDNLHVPKMIAQNAYLLAIDTATDHDYQLSAAPQGRQSEQDNCGILALNAAGEKSNSGPGSPEECW